MFCLFRSIGFKNDFDSFSKNQGQSIFIFATENNLTENFFRDLFVPLHQHICRVVHPRLSGAQYHKIYVSKILKRLVKSFVGPRFGQVEKVPEPHKAERVEARLGCTCCTFYGRKKRTRFRWNHPECGIPLCNVGSGKVEDNCFSICHADETIRQAIFRKYKAMKARTNTKCRVIDN